MEQLTQGISQLIGLTCGAMFLAWFALAVGEFLMRVIINALDGIIE